MQFQKRNGNISPYMLMFSSLVLGAIFLPSTSSECNSCSVTTGLACVSPNEFQFCTNNAPSGQVYSCGSSQLCDIHGRCVSNETSPIVPCGDCEICDDSNTFACLGSRSFALCLGDAHPSDIVGECNDGYICNIENPYICAKVGEGFTATCSYVNDNSTTTTSTTTSSTTTSTTTTTTTPSPITQPAEFCQLMGKTGRFPVGTNLATTCKQYILCLENNNELIGALYFCPNNFYFDDNTRACTRNPPARCSGGIQSLSLNGIELN